MARRQVSTPEDWFEGGEDYSAGTTGGDSTNWSEKADQAQRGRRPALDLSPEGSDFYTRYKFNENTSDVMSDYQDLSYIDNNWPVPQRGSFDPAEQHGWTIEPSEAIPGGESGANKRQSKNGKPRN